MLQLKDVASHVRFVCLSVDGLGPVGVVKCGRYLEEVQHYLREGRTLMWRGPLAGDGWVEVPRKLRNKGQVCRV